MKQFDEFKKAIAFQILVTAAVVAAGAILLGYVSAAKGFVLGSLFSLGNFLIMAHQAPGRLGQNRNKAAAGSFISLLLRLGLLALPLFLAIRLPGINLIWTVIGIFNLQVSILIYSLVIQRFKAAGGPST